MLKKMTSLKDKIEVKAQLGKENLKVEKKEKKANKNNKEEK